MENTLAYYFLVQAPGLDAMQLFGVNLVTTFSKLCRFTVVHLFQYLYKRHDLQKLLRKRTPKEFYLLE